MYLFPQGESIKSENLIVSSEMEPDELKKELESGKNVLLLGSKLFLNLPTIFRITCAGRTSGNLATVIEDHPIFKDMPHDGFWGWQFVNLMTDGSAVCFESDDVPFKPIIEVVSSHKFAICQAALFEFNVFAAKLLVCSFNFNNDEPATNWLNSKLISYAGSEEFSPNETLSEKQFNALITGKVSKAEVNSNSALNINDKTAIRRKNK